MLHKSLLLSAIFICAMGCAGVHYRAIPYQPSCSTCDEGNGVRYYQSSPYLLVYQDSSKLNWQIAFLPDLTRKMTAEPYNFLATVGSNWTFKNGVLTSSKDAGDATVVPKAIVAAAEAFIKIFAARAPTVNPPPPPLLFKIVQEGTTIKFIGENEVRTAPLELSSK